MRWYWWLAIALLLVGAQVSGLLTASEVEDVATRGSKLTSFPVDASAGYVTTSPADCAQAAGGMDQEVYSLARMIRSEEGRSDVPSKTAVAFAAVNRARSAGQSVTALLTVGNTGGGFYGPQNTGGRYAATEQDPYEGDAAIAALVLGGYTADPTSGAEYFDRPKLQDLLLARGTPGYTKSAADVAASREAGGEVLVAATGVDVNELRFWKAA
jgi:hypothetical protein